MPEPTGDLRERLANALRCPVCNVPPGTTCLRARDDNQQPHMARVMEADAVLPVVEAEIAQADRRATQAGNRAMLYRGQVRMEHERAEEAERQRDEALAAVARARQLADEALTAWKPEHAYHQERAERKGYTHDEAAAEAYGRAIEVMSDIIAALDAEQPKETR